MERLVVCSYYMIWISLLRHIDVGQEVNEEVVFPFMFFICENGERTTLKDMFGSAVNLNFSFQCESSRLFFKLRWNRVFEQMFIIQECMT
jgi:hypothetical protein